VSAVLTFATPADERRRPPDLHLRAVLERLPVAVLRIEVNGTLLAVNQAGLGLLGAHALKEVLGTSLLRYVQESGRDRCQRLLEDAGHGQGGSVEIDLCSLTGTPHTLEVQAVPHPGAPDAAASVMVTLRDVTRSRQLAQSLESATARQSDADVQLQAALDEVQQLRARHDALHAERQHDAAQAATQQAEWQRRLDAAAEDIARASTRSNDLERLLADERASLGSRLQELTARLEAERQRFEAETAALRDAERAAQTAWTSEQSERVRAELARQHLVDAIARLAADAGLVTPAETGAGVDGSAASPESGPSTAETAQTSSW
jgi:PAS domain S-box-containing protein